MNTKRFLCVLLNLAILLCLFVSVCAQGEGTVISEGSFDYRLTGTGAEVIKYYPSGSGEVVVPSQVQGHPVTAIGAEVFRNLSGITGIVLQEGIRSIGDRAFYACTDLVSVQLPNTLQSIGEMAFQESMNLQEVVFPAGLFEIGKYAFSGCAALAAAHIPDSVGIIGAFAFSNCGNLKNVVLPDQLQTIESKVFAGCGSLEDICIPDSVQEIANDAFEDTVPVRVRFFTTDQKNVYAGRFPQSQIICLCKTSHTYHPSDLLNCTVCDYVLDLNCFYLYLF